MKSAVQRSAVKEVVRKEQLRELVRKAYVELGRRVIPLKGMYLVRVLPKEQMSKGGTIIIPDLDGAVRQQNKPIYEAVILEVYAAYTKRYDIETETGWERRQYEVVPELAVGEHICFQHWQGVPVHALDLGAGDYRILKEEDIINKIVYQREKEVDLLAALIDANEGGNGKVIAEKIVKFFNVVSKDIPCKTLSGK